jgi:hypothetical protein
VAVSTIDRSALQQGAWVSLVFAVPFSIGSRWVADHDPGSPWASVLWLAALGGFTLGAGIAAWVQRTGFPLLHGLVCAGGTYLAAQAVFIVLKLFRGGTISWLGGVSSRSRWCCSPASSVAGWAVPCASGA